MWEQFAAYHIDRLDATALALGNQYHILGIEVASHSRTYAWTPVESGPKFERATLFPGVNSDDVSWIRKLFVSMLLLFRKWPQAVFVCNQDQPEILVATVLLRIFGIRTFAMFDAKFDDSPRYVIREFLKFFFLKFYSGALVAGPRSVAYYKFLGMREPFISTAFSTVSVDRVRSDANTVLAPAGRLFAARHFIVVARFVTKKNLRLVIKAFARFHHGTNSQIRRLVLCGSGTLEQELRALVHELQVSEYVDFRGFLDHREVARQLANSLVLILPSIEEQWGLVVNEAVALGIPILCAENVGARDNLVRVGVNGYVFEPDNVEGLAELMRMISGDSELWCRLVSGSIRLAPAGDASAFARGVAKLLRLRTRSASELTLPAPEGDVNSNLHINPITSISG